MLQEHQRKYIGVCPCCLLNIYWDEDSQQVLKRCKCPLTEEEIKEMLKEEEDDSDLQGKKE